ncbi:MAG TPA: NIPSNAP family protein [Terriglobia bacterium]|nr:NIPSNAP family protein [Terriglobia bacterium]
MKRRAFLTSSLSAAAMAAGKPPALKGAEKTTDPAGRDFYELRRYELRAGSQAKLTHAYLRDALIPAVNNLGIEPVGVFDIVIGHESPSIYVLLPSPSLRALVTVEAALGSDAAYQQAGKDFLSAPAQSPAYVRMESKLMIAFEGKPTPTVPPAAAARQPRTFELRTYESPSDRDHKRKVEMFHHGEFDIFLEAGFNPVLYGDTLIGTRMPNLTYMLAFDSLDQRNRLWNAFGSSPAWKRLTSSQRYDFEPIVTNVTNAILTPAPYSQI